MRTLASSATEPAHGSVVLRFGETGTAYQRHFSDGLWYPAGGAVPLTWTRLQEDALLYDCPLILVHDAEGLD